MTQLLIALIIFLAIFTQSLVGFGLALVSMPLLVSVVDLGTATPLVALVSLTAEGILLIRYREAFNLSAIRRFTLASIVGIPLGVWALRSVDSAVILPALGVLVVGYALYALFTPRLPLLTNPHWADGLGFVSGVLGGAYNTSGPPIIIYGTCRRWEPAEFKGNLQGFFMLNSVIVAGAHLFAHNFTGPVLQNYLFALPAIGLGALAGFALDSRVNPQRFRKLVLVVLVVLGLTLIG